MKAVRLHDPLDIRFEEVDQAREPGAGEVRVKVAYAGICGSDIHNYKTGQWITRRPSIAGHEFSGVIDTVGSAVSGLTVGDKVVADSRHACNDCGNCRSGNLHLCDALGFVGESIDGGFAEFVTLPERLVVPCDANAGLDIAALAEPLAVALHAIDRIRIGPDEPLLVIGCGPIGALVAVASNILAGRPLLLCDQNQSRVTCVAKASAGVPVELTAFNQYETFSDRTVRHVIDTTGNVKVIARLLETLGGATVGLVGIGAGSLTFDPVSAVERELAIVGCHAFRDELAQAVALLTDHPERFAPLASHRIALADTPAEYRKIAAGHPGGIKTLIEINPGP